MRETPPLFTYGTGVSLRTPERRPSRTPLLIAALALATLVMAGLALAAFLWLATADYGAIFGAARDFLTAHAAV